MIPAFLRRLPSKILQKYEIGQYREIRTLTTVFIALTKDYGVFCKVRKSQKKRVPLLDYTGK